MSKMFPKLKLCRAGEVEGEVIMSLIDNDDDPDAVDNNAEHHQLGGDSLWREVALERIRMQQEKGVDESIESLIAPSEIEI
jgi:hypothetical protein